MIIIGAGMAGLLAARMLAHRSPIVLEKQSSLPNNHSAVLRFRSSIVGDVTGIPFKKVNMIKDVVPWINPVADALSYSYKNTGEYRSDRSISYGPVSAERFIAPPDFIERLARGATIHFDQTVEILSPDLHGPIISTIPMPQLMDILGFAKPVFRFRPGWTLSAVIGECEAYVSLLIPKPGPFSRLSITGNELIIEGSGEMPIIDPLRMLELALDHLGSPKVIRWGEYQENTYNKILPIDETARKQFMFWATDKHNIFSLGRYATWRPGLLLDDLVNDIRLIDRWVDDRYSVAKHRR